VWRLPADGHCTRSPSGSLAPIDKGTTLDFWDLTKLIFRHWRVSLPVLLVTLVLTILTMLHVKPYYVSTAYLQLVPPIAESVPAGDPQPARRNPWLSQSLPTVGNAALITVQDLTYAHQLKAGGYSDKYTVQLGGSNPLVIFTVTGKSRTQARDTADVVVARYEQSLTELQTSYGVAPADMIEAQRLDTGVNITLSSGRVKRAFILVIAGGLFIAIAAVVTADRLGRRRSRLKADAEKRFIARDGPPGPAAVEGSNRLGSPRFSTAPVGPDAMARNASASASVPPASRSAPPNASLPPDRASARSASRSEMPSGRSRDANVAKAGERTNDSLNVEDRPAGGGDEAGSEEPFIIDSSSGRSDGPPESAPGIPKGAFAHDK
jgi:hypothetical protein